MRNYVNFRTIRRIYASGYSFMEPMLIYIGHTGKVISRSCLDNIMEQISKKLKSPNIATRGTPLWYTSL